MRELLHRLEEATFNDKAVSALKKVFGDWLDKLSYLYKAIETVKKQAGVKEIVGKDLESMYDAVDDALVLANRIDMKIAKAMGEDVEIPIEEGMGGQIVAVGVSGEPELVLNPLNGDISVGMGGEWWDGKMRGNKAVLRHKKERIDPAYVPVHVTMRKLIERFELTEGKYDNLFDIVYADGIKKVKLDAFVDGDIGDKYERIEYGESGDRIEWNLDEFIKDNAIYIFDKVKGVAANAPAGKMARILERMVSKKSLAAFVSDANDASYDLGLGRNDDEIKFSGTFWGNSGYDDDVEVPDSDDLADVDADMVIRSFGGSGYTSWRFVDDRLGGKQIRYDVSITFKFPEREIISFVKRNLGREIDRIGKLTVKKYNNKVYKK